MLQLAIFERNMIRFQIPKIFIPGFERILKLKGDDIEKIISFLKNSPSWNWTEEFYSVI